MLATQLIDVLGTAAAARDSGAGRLEVSDFVDHCSDNVRHVTGHPSDSFQMRGAREHCPWAIQLTRRRKPEGTTACWKSRGALKTCRVGRGEARAIRRKLHCLNSRLQRCNTLSLRNHVWRSHRLTAVSLSPPELSVDGRKPMRLLKEPNGAPSSRYISSCPGTWDRLRGASPMATEPS